MLKEAIAAIPQGRDAAFPKDELDRRVAALRATMKAKGFDLFITSGPENIFYLCGQQTPGYYTFACLGVPASGEPFLVIRELESYNARANTYIADITTYADDGVPAASVAAALKKKGWQGKRVAIDRNAWFLTVNIYERLSREFGELLDGSGLVEKLRRVKSPLEIRAMEQAASANDSGMAAGLALVQAGNTDNQIAAAIMQASIAAGAEYVGMEPFVVVGARSGIPHATWRRTIIQPGDVVILETAACWNRYHAALYRTVFVGPVPASARKMYAVCDEAFEAAQAKLKPGAGAADVHNAAQKVIDKHGFTDGFRKRTGYSLGVSFAPDWGEGNILSLYRGVDVEIVPGMCFHVPITLRDYGKFTVAVSESLLVTEKGCRRLSSLPRVALDR